MEYKSELDAVVVSIWTNGCFDNLYNKVWNGNKEVTESLMYAFVFMRNIAGKTGNYYLCCIAS